MEFSFFEVWFIDQNNRPFEIADNMKITLTVLGSKMIINHNVHGLIMFDDIKKGYSNQPTIETIEN